MKAQARIQQFIVRYKFDVTRVFLFNSGFWVYSKAAKVSSPLLINELSTSINCTWFLDFMSLFSLEEYLMLANAWTWRSSLLLGMHVLLAQRDSQLTNEDKLMAKICHHHKSRDTQFA